MLVTKLKNGKEELSRDASLRETSKISKSTPGGIPCIFGDSTLVPIPWMCKKPTAVAHSSVAVRMDGIPAVTVC